MSRNVYPWFEWFPLPETQITNLAVNPGDMVTMLICTTGAGSTSASVFFSNLYDRRVNVVYVRCSVWDGAGRELRGMDRRGAHGGWISKRVG